MLVAAYELMIGTVLEPESLQFVLGRLAGAVPWWVVAKAVKARGEYKKYVEKLRPNLGVRPEKLGPCHHGCNRCVMCWGFA